MNLINQTNKKGIRLLMSWRGSLVNFGSFYFGPDGSLFYSPAFYNDLDKYPYFDIGRWNDITNKSQKERTHKNIKGVHVSLHPRDNVMHVRQKNEKGEDQDILSKPMRWFPVIRPFTFLRIISPPLDKCTFTKKSSDFKMELPNTYTDSIESLIRLFPRNTQVVPALKKSIYNVFGCCPHYWVFCDFILTNRRSAPSIFYPA